MRKIGSMMLFLIAIAVPAGLTEPEDNSPKGNSTTVQKRSINLDTALAIAKVALKSGKKFGHPLAITIADNAGLPLVMLRDDNATEQNFDGARRLAWTVVTMKSSTKELVARVKAGFSDDGILPFIEKSQILLGGVPLKSRGEIVGGVGVSGCP
ncbi:MAG: heme-binding protein, partial [Cyanobacteria bacterium]|nr:heme-binding protein [Cyanobacteriota bacterium]